MLTLRNLEFFLRETSLNIRRNALMSLAAVSTVVVSLCILGSFLLVIVNVDAMATDVSRKVEVTMFFNEQVSEKKAERSRKKILSIDGVKEVEYVSRETALQRLKERLEGQINFSDIEKNNPLPDSLEVSVTDPDIIGDVVTKLKRVEGFDEPEYGKKYAQKILRFGRAVKTIGVVTTALLSLSILLIINNTIRLTIFARRREVRIMQLVGATNWFIKVPFLMEGVLHGIAGSAVASLLLVVAYSYGVKNLTNTLPFIPVVPREALTSHFIVVLNLMGLLFGYTGSLISIRKFLANL